MAKKQWPKLGTIRVSDDGKGNKKTRFVLDPKITLQYDGVEVTLDQYRTAYLKPTESILDSLSFMLENNHIDEKSYNNQKTAVEEKGIRYEVLIPQD